MPRRILIMLAVGLLALMVPGPTTARADPSANTMAAAPYLYLNSYYQPDPVQVMRATGIEWFTVAFVVAPDDSTCQPEWDGGGSLDGSALATINAIRAAGGDVIPSLGGGGVHKLGMACSTATELAAAYQTVIDTYQLKAVDLDIEGEEFQDAEARQRNVAALKILQDTNPDLAIYITVPVFDTGFSGAGKAMVSEAHTAGLRVTAWAGMAFWFGQGDVDMGEASIRAMEGMRGTVQETYGLTEAEAYRQIGLSSLAGVNDDSGETITVADFHQVLAYAFRHQIGRLTFWTVNRDRACLPDGSDPPDTCSGVQQRPYDFTRIVARYHQGAPS